MSLQPNFKKNRVFFYKKLHFIALKFGYLNIYLYLCTQEKVFLSHNTNGILSVPASKKVALPPYATFFVPLSEIFAKKILLYQILFIPLSP